MYICYPVLNLDLNVRVHMPGTCSSLSEREADSDRAGWSDLAPKALEYIPSKFLVGPQFLCKFYDYISTYRR